MRPGTIIMLNGTSSSGKTTLLKTLQKTAETPYLNAGIDTFIFMLPARFLERPLWDEVLGLATSAGDVGHRLFSGMHRTIVELSRAGNAVVADHVLVEERWVEECALLFADLPAYLVGVHCPLNVVIQREQERKDRTLGQALAQFELVHAHTVYDLEVDTSLLSADECAAQILQMVNSGRPPQAFKRLRELV